MTEPVGTLGDEAAKLLAAAQEWAKQRVPVDGQVGGAECQVCPFCQSVALLRQVKPETVEHLLAAAGSLVSALRTTVTPSAPTSPGPAVQHIDVREG